MNNANLAALQFSGAVNSNINFKTYQGTGTTVFPGLTSSYRPDPNSPFFYIFAGLLGGLDGYTKNAFFSTFTFLKGGVQQSQQKIMWGIDDVYNDTPGQGFNITPFIGSVQLAVHSPFAGTCGDFGTSGDGDYNGFVSRWTALCDQVEIQTIIVPGSTYTDEGANYELVHGIIQQPW
jgi:hypothetical protein